MKHTPKPWKIANLKYLNVGIFAYPTPNDEILVASLEPSDEQTANAALIAAAPELLEALCKIVGEVREMCIFDDSEQWDAILGNMEVLIAKAEGRHNT